MGLRDFFDGRFFDTRYKTKIHIAQVALMVLAIILTIWRMAMPVPYTRGNIMALTMVSSSLQEKLAFFFSIWNRRYRRLGLTLDGYRASSLSSLSATNF